MSTYCVGLTGGLASGKTTVGAMFSAHGVVVVEADAIAAELTAPGGEALPALRQALGSQAFTAAGEFDRAAVRRRIFTDPPTRRQLEAILHPLIRTTMKRRLRAARSEYAIGVVPLLFESDGWDDFFHRIAVVNCAPHLQQERAERRDRTGDAAAIMKTQLPPADRLRRADDVIDNNADQSALTAAIAMLHKEYLESARIFIPKTKTPE